MNKKYVDILENIAHLKELYARQAKTMDDLEQGMCMQALWGDELKGGVSCGIQWSTSKHDPRDIHLEVRHNGEKREFKLDDVPAPLRTRKILEFLRRESDYGGCVGMVFLKKHCQKKGWLPDGLKLGDVPRPGSS